MGAFTQLRLFIHDYCNYAFTRQLANALTRRGYEVVYGHNASFDGPNLNSVNLDASGATMLPISTGTHRANKENFAARLKSELAYRKAVRNYLQRERFDAVLSANTPSLVQSAIVAACKHTNCAVIPWVQDLYGVAAFEILRKKLPIAGGLIGKYFIRLDKQSLRDSNAIVIIAEHFSDFVLESGATLANTHVIPNWAPLSEIPLLPKRNSWSEKNASESAFRFVYSGTLAMKHNPALLLQLAEGLHKHFHATGQRSEVLVISSSSGAKWVEAQCLQRKLSTLRRLDFQSQHDFPAVLACADVLIAVLEPAAAMFSVPSKILSYLCSGRPILSAMPTENLAAQTILKAGAGLVVPPNDNEGFAQAGLEMMRSPATNLERWGQAARAYATSEFDIEKISDRFESIVRPFCAT